MNSTRLGTITELWRYPIKSMQGEQLTTADLDTHGIAGDRRLALRDLTTGNIISAKVPAMGRPLLTCSATTSNDGRVSATVNGTTYDVDAQRKELDAALTELLCTPVRIEHAGDQPETYTSEWPQLDDMALSNVTVDLPLSEGTFADLAPLHLITRTSLQHLNTLDPSLDVSIRRFRPGIVLAGGATLEPASFVENDWAGQKARIGDTEITFGSASPRCIMTTLEQPGLDSSLAVLTTLAKHNRRDFEGFGNFACLGVYAEITTAGTINVGDHIEKT